ncbi:LCP family protein [Streptomyces albireticuli]|uniref:Transcriptional regulator n=1 Tax=Streptomyces albireticuli TaxID=1940 RepID=A0A2A2D982_9ACTN|nr:LCP family protein [Streptomyces albireticuli]MCD9144599.1 LCP family protein [Streptomyces albireticuli]MCD9163338.1 LCP family protein [Streptomyces albireticuli]MCD9193277.1 LCP family protein [Streptomyces albireticuli]PAU48007.1 transcriptional regulator [Streptomyces albireticuli]
MRDSSVRGPRARGRVPGARGRKETGAAGKITAKTAGKPEDAPETGAGESGAAGTGGNGSGGGKHSATKSGNGKHSAPKSGDTKTSGTTAGDGKSGHGKARARRTRAGRIARWTALCLAVLILGTAAAGYFYYEHLNGNLKKDALNLGDKRLDRSAANAAGQRPLNILLLGSDSRNSAENVALGGAREDAGRKPLADVQMLVHVSADRSNMSVISVPRDTRVTIPKCTDPEDGKVYRETDRQIINTSLMNGGPGCTVATWEELTGIPVDHFMMIDFAGVVNMADAVGGVPVCVDNNVYDDKSGLRLRKGRHNVKGEQALQWLRTRHGFEDGSDIGRTHAQHMYMNSMVRQLKSGTKLSDPGQLTDLAEAATKALTVDKDLGSVKKLYDLADDIKRVPSGRITMTTMPWVSDPQNPDAHVVPKPGDADKLFSLVRNDIALDGKDKKKEKSASPAAPSGPKSAVDVTVFNGTGTAAQPVAVGRGSDIAAFLVKQGFSKATADSTPRSQADTTLSYAKASQRGDAEALAKALGLPDSALRMSTAVDGLTLVVGGDWRTGTSYPKAADDAKDDPKKDGAEKDGEKKDSEKKDGKGDDNKAPESSDPLNGNDTSACMKVNSLNRF